MRRLFPLCVAALLVGSNGFAKAQISDDVVKIGVLTDLSGPSSAADGPGSVAAAQMAVDDFGGQVLGKPIQSHFRRSSDQARYCAPVSPGDGTTATKST